nr:preprotein translocase subunit SecG [Pseudoclavibacter chungangensis]
MFVDIVLVVLQVLLAITSVLLILFVLLHRGRGGGLSDMFGGGVTSNIGSSGVAEKNLNRITVWLAIIWVLCIVFMGLIIKLQSGV